jgi:hypothetical protein
MTKRIAVHRSRRNPPNPIRIRPRRPPSPIKKRTPLISTRFSAQTIKRSVITYHNRPLSTQLNSWFRKRLYSMRRLHHSSLRISSHNHNLSTLRQLEPSQKYLLIFSSSLSPLTYSIDTPPSKFNQLYNFLVIVNHVTPSLYFLGVWIA